MYSVSSIDRSSVWFQSDNFTPSSIAETDDRCKKLETLCSLVTMHTNGECHCFKTHIAEYHCPGAKYLWGEIDLTEFYAMASREEAV